MCICAHAHEHVCAHVLHMCRCPWRPNRTLVPLDLQLQAVLSHLTWVLASKVKSSERAASLSAQTITLGPQKGMSKGEHLSIPAGWGERRAEDKLSPLGISGLLGVSWSTTNIPVLLSSVIHMFHPLWLPGAIHPAPAPQKPVLDTEGIQAQEPIWFVFVTISILLQFL